MKAGKSWGSRSTDELLNAGGHRLLKGQTPGADPSPGLGATEAPDRTEPVLIWLIKTQGGWVQATSAFSPGMPNNVTSES